jgi:hypothetical protein
VRDEISKQHNSAIDDRAMENFSDNLTCGSSMRPSPRKPNVETDAKDAGVYALDVSAFTG